MAESNYVNNNCQWSFPKFRSWREFHTSIQSFMVCLIICPANDFINSIKVLVLIKLCLCACWARTRTWYDTQTCLFPAVPLTIVEVNQEKIKDYTGWLYPDYHHLMLNMRYIRYLIWLYIIVSHSYWKFPKKLLLYLKL